jgi:hypothetical protein
MITGGTPVSNTKGVATARAQPGARGQAAIAPSRFPITKLRMVVTSSRPRVQGSACMMTSITVDGYLFRE